MSPRKYWQIYFRQEASRRIQALIYRQRIFSLLTAERICAPLR
jgi:hypothetical protein